MSLVYFGVTAKIAPLIADIAGDSDYNPNVDTAVSADVTFRAALANGDVLKVTDVSPKTMYIVTPIVGTVDGDGLLKLRTAKDLGGSGTYVPVRLLGNSDSLNLATPLFYTFTLSNIRINGAPTTITINGGSFEAPDHDTTIDLIDYIASPAQIATGVFNRIAPSDVRIVDGDKLQWSFDGQDIPSPIQIPNAETNKYAETLGDDTETVFTVTHGLNTRDVIVNVYELLTGDAVDATVTITDADTVTVEFGAPPDADSVRVVVLGAAFGLGTIGSSDIYDASELGRELLGAATTGSARAVLDAGAIGDELFRAEDEGEAWETLGFTTVGQDVVTAEDGAAARTAIGAGTSSLVLGTTAGTAKAGDYHPAATNITDSTSVGRAVLTAADAAAARTALKVQRTPQDIVALAGIDNTGATNVRAAIQTFIDANYAAGPIKFPAGSYLLGDAGATSGGNAIVLPNGARIVADPDAVFMVNARDFQSGRTAIFYAAGTEGTKVSFTTDQVKHSATVTLPTGGGASFAVGDIIALASNATYAYEIHKVQEVSGDVVRLDSSTDEAYLVADTAQYWKVTPVTVSFEGGKFVPGPGIDYTGPAGSTHSYAIRIKYGSGVVLRDIHLENMTGGVNLEECIDTLVDGLNVDRLPIQNNDSTASGYGLLAVGGCANLVVNGLRGRETRHLFTTLNNSAYASSGPRDIQINNAIGYGSSFGGYAIFDTHYNGRRIQFNQCLAVGTGYFNNVENNCYGFQIRARDVFLNNCVAAHCSSAGVRVTSTSSNVIISGQYFGNEDGLSLSGSSTAQILPNTNIFDNYNHGVRISATTDTTISGRIFNNGRSGVAARVGIADSNSTPSTNTIVVGAFIPYSSTQPYAFNYLSSTATVINCNLPGYSGNLDYGGAVAAKMVNVATDSAVEYTRPIKVSGSSVVVSGGALGTPSSGTLTNCTGLPQSGVTSLTSDLAAKEATANKNQNSGYCGLDSGGKVATAQLPTTLASWDAKTAPTGTVVGRTVVNATDGSTLGAPGDYVVFVGSGGAPVLPTAVGNTGRYVLKNIHSANVTVSTTSAQTVEGATTYTLGPGASIDLFSDGSNWRII